jgi:hypothetical protein
VRVGRFVVCENGAMQRELSAEDFVLAENQKKTAMRRK